MPTLPRTSVLLALLALASPATAGPCEVTTSPADFEAAGFYAFQDETGCSDPCLAALWIYQESNGIAGLQRHDVVRDDTCGGQVEGDKLVF